MSGGYFYRCSCNTLYAEDRGAWGCPSCQTRQKMAAKLEPKSATGADVDLRKLTPQPGTVSPTIPGYYVVWLIGQIYPITLSWGRWSNGWRRGAMAVNARAWAGPLPEVLL